MAQAEKLTTYAETAPDISGVPILGRSAGVTRGGVAIDPAPKKLHWRLVKALDQMNTRRAYLIDKRSELTKEIEEIDAAILALE